jgi:hypothetical protein
MIFALLLALAAAPDRLVLMDETVEVPPARWRAFDLELRQRPARIDCNFAVVGGGSGVRVALLRREDLGRLHAGERHRELAATEYERAASLRYQASEGAYSLVVDNRLEGGEPAAVHVRVALVFANGMPEAMELPPGRKAVVIALSILFFAAVVFFAGRKLGPALFTRPPRNPPPPLWG